MTRDRPVSVHRVGQAMFGDCEPRRRSRRHVIAAITYQPGVPSELAPMDCSCGWSGLAMQYAAHRAEQGERRAWQSGGRGRQDAA